MTRRSLKDAVKNRDELNFVFGVTPENSAQVIQTIQDTKEQLIPRHKIICSFTFVPDNKPVRHYYDPEELEQWALNDIKPNGILSPLWVRPHPFKPGYYELIAGLRRFKAGEVIDLDEIPVKVFDWDNETAYRAAISENANRRDFTVLEELDNTLRLLEIELKYDTPDVVSLLYRMNNATKGMGTTNQNVLVSEEAEIVQRIFSSYGKITWQSFVATRLPLLKKPPEILEAIREGKIHYTKGILLATVKDSAIRQQLLTEVIAQPIGITEIKQKIKSLMGTDHAKASQSTDLKQRLSETIQAAKKNKQIWSDPEKTQRIEKLIEELQAVLN